MQPGKYPLTLIFIHWMTLALLILNFLLGKNLENYDFTAENFRYYRVHALVGALIFFMTLWRLYLLKKHRDKLPELEYYSAAHRLMVKGVHLLIYLLLLAIPLSGIYMIYSSGAYVVDLGKPFPEGAKLSHDLIEFHETLVGILIVLVVLHLAGVLHYKYKKDDEILRRMLFFL